MYLDIGLHSELKSLHTRMLEQGELHSLAALDGFYATFRSRFGPDRLATLSGNALLDTMHARNHDSLMYWLEFKNDGEFPTTSFGGIAGGSAYKFGMFQTTDGRWISGSPQHPQEIIPEVAVTIADKQRSELLAAVDRVAAFPDGADDAESAALQRDLGRVAPSISHLAWPHKYLHLLFPAKLADYHTVGTQKYHLIRLLQIPPGEGLYDSSGRYMAIARELAMVSNHLTNTLNEFHHGQYRYWRIGTRDEASQQSQWELMKSGSYVAIGWPALGDLAWLLDESIDGSSREKLRSAIVEHYPNDTRAVGRAAQQVVAFVTKISERDLVLASDGTDTLAIGRITGPYAYDSRLEFPHIRPVEWLSFTEWKLPTAEGLQTTVAELGKNARNLVAVEQRILGAQPIKPILGPKPLAIREIGPTPSLAPRPVVFPTLEGVAGRIQSVLERKGQVIVYGPPGTGKTYWALQAAQDLAAYSAFALPFQRLSGAEMEEVRQPERGLGLVRVCTFHPAYGYEDFLEGYRPTSTGQQLTFERQPGIFKRLCDDAASDPERRYYLVIDEINRGDIPRIFGELLTVLEKDKRGHGVLLPLSGQLLRVPDNVYVIGTMNTADRSIALLDAALRRRFGFVEIMPDITVLGSTVISGVPLGRWLAELNRRLVEHLGRDARNLQIGHAYFLERGQPIGDFGRLTRMLQDDLVPLLEEYCYEDFSALARILGAELVNESQQRIQHELFDLGRRDDLVHALLAPCPELATMSEVVAASAAVERAEADEGNEDPEVK